MTLPQQVQNISHNRRMKAPYNFVPLPEKVLTPYTNEDEIPDHDIYNPKLHTGFIDLWIEVETLLYTRCAYDPAYVENPVTQCQEKQQFFHYKDRNIPVIPGSSIRGMLRSLVEILGFCQVGREQIAEDYLIYRAVADRSSLGQSYRKTFMGDGHILEYPLDNVRGGYLRIRNGRWYIQPAVRHGGESFVHTRQYPTSFAPARHPSTAAYGSSDIKQVWLIPPTRGHDSRNGRPTLNIAQANLTDIVEQSGPYSHAAPSGSHVPGVLVRSGHMPNKHRHCVIYEGDPNTANWIIITDKIWQRFAADRDMNRGIPTRRLLNDGDSLFYLVDNSDNLIFFGPTKMFRIPYQFSTLDFIPEHVKSPRGIDLAAAIFGNTKKKGRVRCLDAIYAKNISQPFLRNNYQGRIIPKILSSPKPTSFQNYLVQQNTSINQLSNYNQPYSAASTEDAEHIGNNNSGAVIRGYKYYWNKSANIADIEESDGWNRINIPKPQHTVIRPVKPETKFTGRIYFENLTSLELGALITALKLKDNNSRHRLGMGKPYGMGRVKIDWNVTLEERKKRYGSFRLAADQYINNTKDRIDEALKSFKEAILNHSSFNSVQSIWEISRLQALGLLLSKNGPPAEEAEYVGIANRTEGNRWRERQVLPTPQQIVKQNIQSTTPGPMQPIAHSIHRAIANNQIVECVVLEETTKKGKLKIQVKDREGKGVLHPQSTEPPDFKPGKVLKLRVKSNDPKNMHFEWTEDLNL